jgi:glycosyltransferase involved in cell wall biosynthesis
MPNPLGELGALAGKRTRPMVVSFHAQLGRQKFLAPIYDPLQRGVLARASAVLVASAQLAEAPEVQRVMDRLHVLPYGVSPRFADVVAVQTDRQKALRVLFVGRLVYYKGVEVLLRAVAEMEGVNVTIVGDGPLRGELEALSLKLGLGTTVRFLGSVSDDDLALAYGAHDVFVLPSVSRAEAFGLALAEAMSSGLPAVSTRLGTATDWVNQDGTSGLVVPPGNVEALIRALEDLREPDTRRRLATGARARARELFSFDRHCDALFGVYGKVL